MRRLIPAGVVLMVALAIVLLSRFVQPSQQAPAPQDDTGLRAAVETYSVRYLAGDSAAAYTLLSARCQQHWGRANFAKMVGIDHAIFGSQPPSIATLSAQIAGERAAVTYTYAGPGATVLNQAGEPWIYQGGWRKDDC